MNNLSRMAICAALTAVLAQIILPVPFSPVPFSTVIIAVFLCGAILEKKSAFLAMVVYLLMGLVGMPVFGGLSGGPGILFGPTGGYIMSYPIMAFLTAFILEKIKRKNLYSMIFSMLPSLLICYVSGTLWLQYVTHMTIQAAFLAGVAPFIIFDVLKIILVSFIAPKIDRLQSR